MRCKNLDQWLLWQEKLHPKKIDLSLQRVEKVWRKLHPEDLPFTVITVAGTNGKGSCVSYLHHMLAASGKRVGSYTSPHMLRYNERVLIDTQNASDADFCQAFARIDEVRGDISLTYFEFGTLAAMLLFVNARLDVVVLEVGLGGRLDAVNVYAPDYCLITNIGLDHCEWLGSDRESIAIEKAGILRHGIPLVCADPDPPKSLLAKSQALNVPLYQLGKDFGYRALTHEWELRTPRAKTQLPYPKLPGAFQLNNASAACQLLELGDGHHWQVSTASMRAGLGGAYLPGRLQQLNGFKVPVIVDVAHNGHAAQALAAELGLSNQRTHAVFSCLKNKDIAAIIEPMHRVIDTWYVAQIDHERAESAENIADYIKSSGGKLAQTEYSDVNASLVSALTNANADDRIIVFGSFYLVSNLLEKYNAASQTDLPAA